MLTWLKLLQHRDHSGHLRPHEHTSYLPLLVILLVVGLALTTFTTYASPGPEPGSIGLTGIVPGKPPTIAATITTPSDQKRFSTSPITVAGTCPQNTLVEIFKNDIFAGSSACSDGGAYSLEVDMIIGKNTLKAIRSSEGALPPIPDLLHMEVTEHKSHPNGRCSVKFENLSTDLFCEHFESVLDSVFIADIAHSLAPVVRQRHQH